MEKIAYYLVSKSERISIADNGSKRLEELTRSDTYRSLIDDALGNDGFILS